MELALEPGEYRVFRDLEHEQAEATLCARDGGSSAT